MMRRSQLFNTMLIMIILIVGPLAIFVAGSIDATATHNASFCKWNFPWPRTVLYWINTGAGQFSSDHATRVQYGGNTWTEAGYNLILLRTSTRNSATNYSEVIKGYVPFGATAATDVPLSSNCNVDSGNPITGVVTIYNSSKNFHDDCLAMEYSHGYNWCNANNYYDIHEVSAHEFGHWFTIYDHDLCFSVYTMDTCIQPGDTYRRTLHSHDRSAAWIMYGCRSGYSCN